MARVSDEELDRLKAEVSVQRLVEAHGVELKRHGESLLGRCPFHEDKTPSLVVTPKKNLWHCMGACQTGGSVVDWVMKTEGVSFRHAIELLRADMPNTGNTAKVATVRKLSPPVEPSADDKLLLRQVVDYYHQTLKQSPEALAYLEKRGLKSMELVDHFKLGFANRTLGLRLPLANRKAGADLRGRLQKLGVLRESGHEHFNGSLVIPVLDEQGEVLELYGRKVTENLRPGTPLHLYLPGPHRGVFNPEPLRRYKQVILCEALIDALTFWNAGFKNVTASFGCEGFLEEHVALFKRNGIDSVLIAYDRDAAGDKAAETLAKRLIDEGFECWRLLFPRGMDANEYALKMKPAHKALELVIRQAQWMGKGKGRPAELLVTRSLPSLAAQEVPVSAAAPVIAATISTAAPAMVATSASAITPAEGPVIAAALEAPVDGEQIDPPTATAATEPDHSAPVIVGTISKQISTVAEEMANATASAGEEIAIDPAPASAEPLASSQPGGEVPRALEVPTEVKEDEVVVTLGERRYRVRGLSKNLSPEVLKVNLLVSHGEGFHVDTLDLYAAKARAFYVKQAAAELRLDEEVLKRDMGKVLLKLEELQEEQLKKALAPKEKVVTVGEKERDAALELLQAPDLLERILADFEKCGVVGEETNKLVGYLAAVSRKLEDPLAVIIQSSSAAGKSSLMEAVLALVPEEDRVKYSAMTGQSLFYMGDTNLKHKVLAIVEEEGASRAAYALKLLQSEGELTIASTGKDPTTGRLVTQEYRVEGPVMIFLTTTAIELDEELLNRCLVLTVDEDREQTRAIHRMQRERQTLEGLLARRDRDAVLAVHRNAQRLLRPLLVANPYARELTFLDDRTRTRRDHTKYLTLIRTIALLHQYQRPVKTVTHEGQVVEYIEVTREDLAVANRLAHQVLGRSLDELPPQTRRLLLLVEQMVAAACAKQQVERKDYRFTRKDVRAATGWGDTQLRIHLQRLVELEYLLTHAGRRGQNFLYELVYDGQGKDGTPFLAGLVDVEQLGREYDSKNAGVNGNNAGPSRPQSGANAAGGRPGETAALPSENTSPVAVTSGKARLELRLVAPSYSRTSLTAGA